MSNDPSLALVCAQQPASQGSVGSSGSTGSEQASRASTKPLSACTTSADKAKEKFLELPPPPPAALPVNCTKGWPSYLASRWPGSAGIVERVQADPCTLDGLTYPITVAFILTILKYVLPRELTVLIIGAMGRVEERLLRETTYWGEIAVCLRCRVHLVLCGPEVSATRESGDPRGAPNPNSDTRTSLFRGSFEQYCKRYSIDPASTVVVAFNAGFGTFGKRFKLGHFFTWLPELRAVVDSGLPAFFTQASGEDLAGETAAMTHILGARYIAMPTQNAFTASTRWDSKDSSEMSCANHSFYGVQGCEEARSRCRKAQLGTLRGQSEVRAAVIRAVGIKTDLNEFLVPLHTRMDALSPTSATQLGGLRLNGGVHTLSEGGAPRAKVPRVAEGPVSGKAPATPTLEAAAPSEDSSPESAMLLPAGGAAALLTAANQLSPVKKPGQPVPNCRIEVCAEEGVIRATVSLPLLDSAKAVDLEVYRGQLFVGAEGVYSTLKVTLPSPVNEDSVVAKFDRQRRELELTLQARSKR